MRLQTGLKLLMKVQRECPELYVQWWGQEDFEGHLEMPFTKQDTICMVETMYHRFDANHGVNWNFIDFCADEIGFKSDRDTELDDNQNPIPECA